MGQCFSAEVWLSCIGIIRGAFENVDCAGPRTGEGGKALGSVGAKA